MCTVSMITDHYREKWQERLTATGALGQYSPPNGTLTTFTWPPQISPEELAEFKALLERARAYDKRTGQADCELDEKRQAVKNIAKQLGVEIAFL